MSMYSKLNFQTEVMLKQSVSASCLVTQLLLIIKHMHLQSL